MKLLGEKSIHDGEQEGLVRCLTFFIKIPSRNDFIDLCLELVVDVLRICISLGRHIMTIMKKPTNN